MAGISAAAVLVTLAVVLVPVYVLSRDLLTQVLGEQVTAVTRSTSVAISGDSLDRIAERGHQLECLSSDAHDVAAHVARERR